ncbi:hypothetical protein QCA50_014909 [Cerrena zonata]|uniref:Uncharacterized protein n=1 Tax=Cerrena zonata TaxID=2478898 RepID=A0AAW0FRP1_9APHY
MAQIAGPSDSSIFPNELVDMFIDCMSGDVESLKTCSLVHSSWLPRARSHLFTRLVIRPRKRHGVWQIAHVPMKMKNDLSSTTRDLVKYIKVDCLSRHSPNTIQLNANIMWSIFWAFPNAAQLEVHVYELGPGNTYARLNPELSQRRVMDCVELHSLHRFDENAYIYEFLSLFSEIKYLHIDDVSASFKGYPSKDEKKGDIPHFPKIHNLVTEDLVSDDFIYDLFRDRQPSRLASLQSLQFRLFIEPTTLDLSTLLDEVGEWLPKLELGIYDPLSAFLHHLDSHGVEDDGLLQGFGDDFWRNQVDWDLCPALEDLTIYADICCGSHVESRMPVVALPMLVAILEHFPESTNACVSTKTPLRLTLELRAVSEDCSYNLVEYCKYAPFKDLEAHLRKLHTHPDIQLGHVTIKLCGHLHLFEEKDVETASALLAKGIKGMGLDFVDDLIVAPTKIRMWGPLC